jgi:DNA-binding response OmpR family regulator
MKLLVVDDDPDLAALVAFALTNAGYSVVKAGDTAEALRVFDAELPNLVILDINLPSGSGFDVCKSIRGRSAVPIMMLTARGEEEDLVRALELGADDYLTKPFSPRTLLARVKALLRRAGIEAGDKVEAGQVSLDLEAHAISIAGGAPIRLTRLETRLLQILVGTGGARGFGGAAARARLGSSRERRPAAPEAARTPAPPEAREGSWRSRAVAHRIRRRLSPESLRPLLLRVDLVEQAAVREVLSPAPSPSRRNPRSSPSSRPESGGVLLQHGLVPRPVIVLRDDFLRLG